MGTRTMLAAFVIVCCWGCGGAGDVGSIFSTNSDGSSSDSSDDGSGGSTDTSGGSDSSSGSNSVSVPPPPPPPSPFAGHYVGTWTSANDSGTSDLRIAIDGTVSGRLHDNNRNTTAGITGSIVPTGALAATASVGFSASSLEGTLSLSPANHLVGILVETGASMSFNLVQQ